MHSLAPLPRPLLTSLSQTQLSLRASCPNRAAGPAGDKRILYTRRAGRRQGEPPMGREPARRPRTWYSGSPQAAVLRLTST